MQILARLRWINAFKNGEKCSRTWIRKNLWTPTPASIRKPRSSDVFYFVHPFIIVGNDTYLVQPSLIDNLQ